MPDIATTSQFQDGYHLLIDRDLSINQLVERHRPLYFITNELQLGGFSERAGHSLTNLAFSEELPTDLTGGEFAEALPNHYQPADLRDLLNFVRAFVYGKEWLPMTLWAPGSQRVKARAKIVEVPHAIITPGSLNARSIRVSISSFKEDITFYRGERILVRHQ